ncbi:2,3-dihydro-2,3-dihydroxybenzoate dehydrogenase [Paenibacillus sp. JNUCC31]|uniref:2,3-dihydro-2,3-dihydroxybenzoate dehydrogenase n=1 Tax=Paenibacillus sp. JNUCC-31 TaxID=2777983 RepID=UPI001785724A|nr:2,3-dihydro-2,3-dihydroxybenzoate dehydrogenase [Paenibacillus sp. JNUCC-31]QOS81774.1 2,3-dihydro-2,3-dihydroxybenzoate dehydrogenase [Paenibacillus sp. JNUCC-31]
MSYTGIDGKVAVVTGAAQGIGEAVARLLAQQGAIIAAVDIREDQLNQLVTDLRNQSHQATACPVDISDHQAVEAVVQLIEETVGPIGILVNAAGVLYTGAVSELRDEEWTKTFDVNTHGVFYMSRAVVRNMAERQSGAIVTVGSNASGVPRMHMSAYAASKAASTIFTKCLALEYASQHIRCNIVSPGSTDTAMQRALWQDEQGAQAVIAGSQEDYRLGIPLNRLALPSDIADSVLFMVSDQARHITMHDLCVDGGATLGA